MARRTVGTCDRCGADYEPTSSTREEVLKSGAVTLVAVRPDYALADIHWLAEAMSVMFVRAAAKDLCEECSEAFRAFMAGGSPDPVGGGPRGA